MILAVHQPQYLPWLGYFDKMDRADVFCVLDDVQYKKNEWQNRNRIKTAQGWQWLTVPVHYRFPQKISDVTIDNRKNWRQKHLRAIAVNYGRAKYFNDYIGFFEQVYAQSRDYLADLNFHLIVALRRLLGMKNIPIWRSCQMRLRSDPTDRLIDICRHTGADTYLSGSAGAGYMDLKQFEAAGITVHFQAFDHPVYPQLYGGFESHLSIVDLLMNCGTESLLTIRGKHGV